jgi:hypothetical protein
MWQKQMSARMPREYGIVAVADESSAKEGRETVMQCSEPQRASVLVGLPPIANPLLL